MTDHDASPTTSDNPHARAVPRQRHTDSRSRHRSNNLEGGHDGDSNAPYRIEPSTAIPTASFPSPLNKNVVDSNMNTLDPRYADEILSPTPMPPLESRPTRAKTLAGDERRHSGGGSGIPRPPHKHRPSGGAFLLSDPIFDSGKDLAQQREQAGQGQGPPHRRYRSVADGPRGGSNKPSSGAGTPSSSGRQSLVMTTAGERGSSSKAPIVLDSSGGGGGGRRGAGAAEKRASSHSESGMVLRPGTTGSGTTTTTDGGGVAAAAVTAVTAVTGLDADSAQIVSMALNLSESRRLAARRNTSQPLPPRLAPLPDNNAAGGPHLRQHLQQQRRASRNMSPGPERALRTATAGGGGGGGGGIGGGQIQFGARVASPLQAAIDLTPEGNIIPYGYHISQSTLARVQKARDYLELLAQYRRALDFMPPLKPGAAGSEPASPTSPVPAFRFPGGGSQSVRPYNPLQYVRNRKVRARERKAIDGEAQGFNDVERVTEWVDELEGLRSSHGDSNHSDGGSGSSAQLPPWALEGESTAMQTSPPQTTTLKPGPVVVGSKPKRPRVDWVINPADLIADLVWLEQGDNKMLVEDRHWRRVFPQDPGLYQQRPLSRDEGSPEPVMAGGAGRGQGQGQGHEVISSQGGVSNSSRHHSEASQSGIKHQNQQTQQLQQQQQHQRQPSQAAKISEHHEHTPTNTQSARERAQQKLRVLKVGHHRRGSSHGGHGLGHGSHGRDILRLRRSSVSDSSGDESDRRRAARHNHGSIGSSGLEVFEKQMLERIAREERENPSSFPQQQMQMQMQGNAGAGAGALFDLSETSPSPYQSQSQSQSQPQSQLQLQQQTTAITTKAMTPDREMGSFTTTNNSMINSNTATRPSPATSTRMQSHSRRSSQANLAETLGKLRLRGVSPHRFGGRSSLDVPRPAFPLSPDYDSSQPTSPDLKPAVVLAPVPVASADLSPESSRPSSPGGAGGAGGGRMGRPFSRVRSMFRDRSKERNTPEPGTTAAAKSGGEDHGVGTGDAVGVGVGIDIEKSLSATPSLSILEVNEGTRSPAMRRGSASPPPANPNLSLNLPPSAAISTSSSTSALPPLKMLPRALEPLRHRAQRSVGGATSGVASLMRPRGDDSSVGLRGLLRGQGPRIDSVLRSGVSKVSELLWRRDGEVQASKESGGEEEGEGQGQGGVVVIPVRQDEEGERDDDEEEEDDDDDDEEEGEGEKELEIPQRHRHHFLDIMPSFLPASQQGRDKETSVSPPSGKRQQSQSAQPSPHAHPTRKPSRFDLLRPPRIDIQSAAASSSSPPPEIDIQGSRRASEDTNANAVDQSRRGSAVSVTDGVRSADARLNAMLALPEDGESHAQRQLRLSAALASRREWFVPEVRQQQQQQQIEGGAGVGTVVSLSAAPSSSTTTTTTTTASSTMSPMVLTRRELARLRALMLSSGIRAAEMERRVQERKLLTSPRSTNTRIQTKKTRKAATTSDEDDDEGEEEEEEEISPTSNSSTSQFSWAQLAALCPDTTARRDLLARPIAQADLFRVAGHVLGASVQAAGQRWQATSDALAMVTAPRIQRRVEMLRARISGPGEESLSALAAAAADEADEVGRDLAVQQPLRVKRAMDAMDKMLRRRRRRFRWARRAGWLAVEWVLVGFMWYVWFVVMIARVFLGVGRGFVRGVRWLLWL